MKKFYFLITAFCCFCSFGQDLIITGVFDGPLPGGTPKMIEFFVLDNIPDLSVYGFGSANNGGGTDGQEFAFSGNAVAGDFIYVSSPTTDNDPDSPTLGQTFFEVYFGFPPTFTSGFSEINGDDAIELFKDGVVVDLFGDINTDGSGEVWEYMDGWAYRSVGVIAPSSVFNSADWTFSGTNVNDGETSNSTAETPFPIGSFEIPVLDNPNFAALQNEIVLYPNPSSTGAVALSTPINSEVEATLYNSLGDALGTQIVNGNEAISTEGLAAGIYFVQLTIDGKTTTKRIVIQ